MVLVKKCSTHINSSMVIIFNCVHLNKKKKILHGSLKFSDPLKSTYWLHISSMYSITLLYGYLKIQGKLQSLLIYPLYISSLAHKLNSLCLLSLPLRHFSMMYLSNLAENCTHISLTLPSSPHLILGQGEAVEE